MTVDSDVSRAGLWGVTGCIVTHVSIVVLVLSDEVDLDVVACSGLSSVVWMHSVDMLVYCLLRL